MLLQIDLQAEEPIYTQIMHQVIEGIAKQELKPGDDLPSVRSLASDIGINFHTVNKAYQLLKQEGYILIHRQKGVVIHPDGVERATEAFYAKLRKKVRPLIAESICKSVTKAEWERICATIYEEIEPEEEQ
ncbi:GntR family transcriptional regulator [Listeria grandensis]|uniref:GntR family transcriptional regulator n=1 Tax=Listeria grandensis TaxID=1494963 RepID=A0A7X1CQU6_9LIST|nr:GntR family transcriptional regulator [Listeria grandensis]MBC1475852.1 GntR family transcriptional regulator [Listeria grandensis]MBC1937387.1 GntR family transcriptional regulator [Listeria grandensis]MBC6314202.1 GntR family transcriptional regulator [Listeria grandensis]